MSKARNLSDFISDPTISSTEIADQAVTHPKLHGTMDLSSKTVTLPTLSTLNTTGNVGIGTSSPDMDLHVLGGEVLFEGTGNSKLQIKAGNTSSSFIEFADAEDGNVGRILYGHSDNSMQFTVNASERMRIDSSGKVGIGTTNPLDALHIASVVSTDYRGNVFLQDTTSMAAGVGGQLTFGGNYTGSGQITEWSAIQGTKSNSSDDYSGQIEFKTRKQGYALQTKMTLDADGNVGIGTSSMGYPAFADNLTIADNANAGITIRSGTTNEGSIYFSDATGSGVSTYAGYINYNHASNIMRFATGSSVRAVIDSSGNVGIGTSSPSSWAKLDILGTGGLQNGATQALQVRSPSTTAGEGVGIRLNAASGSHEAVGIIGMVNNPSGNAGAMTFHTYNLGATIPERMRINNLGNVGIGTSSPSEKLHVEGDARLADAGSIQFGSSKYQTLSGLAGSNDLLYRTYATHIFKTATGPSSKTDGTERMRINNDGLSIGTGTGGGNPPQNTSVLFGSSDNRNIQFLGQTASGVEGIIGAWNGVYNFQSSKIVFNKPAGNVGEIQFYTNQGAGPVKRMTIQNGGTVAIVGALSKGSGSFKIDHPLPSKTETHDLVHSFVESPQANNIYRGKVVLVDGSATINIDTVSGMTDGTYVLLNTNTQCFTSNETGWTAVKGSVSGNTLTINSEVSCTDTISWMVIGERHDQHMIDTDWTNEEGQVIVEPLKEE